MADEKTSHKIQNCQLTDSHIISQRQNISQKYNKSYPLKHTKLGFNEIKSYHQIQPTIKQDIVNHQKNENPMNQLIELLQTYNFNLTLEKTNNECAGIITCPLFVNQEIGVSIIQINSNPVTRFKISQLNTTDIFKVTQQNIFISSLQIIIDLSNDHFVTDEIHLSLVLVFVSLLFFLFVILC